jgi:histidyl-tRNA synthetase
VPEERLDAFVVDTSGRDVARTLAHELREAGWRVDRAFEGRSMKSQMRAADRSGAAIAVIVGADELAAGTVTLRPLRGGEQETVPREKLLHRLSELLAP